MRILAADDDPSSLEMLEGVVGKWGYEVVSASDGTDAMSILGRPEAPGMAILDWVMPGLDGIEVCRRIKTLQISRPPYIIMLTIRGERKDMVEALDAGADDYIAKPYDISELRARLNVGRRIVELQSALAENIEQLKEALAQVKTLQGILPICMYCKRIRDDKDYWQQVERYVATHSEAQFSHSICPDCYDKIVKPQLETIRKKGGP